MLIAKVNGFTPRHKTLHDPAEDIYTLQDGKPIS
jgi:hypothetical protein